MHIIVGTHDVMSSSQRNSQLIITYSLSFNAVCTICNG